MLKILRSIRTQLKRVRRVGLVLLISLSFGCSGQEVRPEFETLTRTTMTADQSPAPLLEGLASWYGKRFHRRKTASGERFNMHEFTAAHRTLPFGTRLKVRNLDTGHSTEVRVNDRGPFKKSRMIDLSYAAAKALGILRSGVGRVQIEVLSLPLIAPST